MAPLPSGARGRARARAYAGALVAAVAMLAACGSGGHAGEIGDDPLGGAGSDGGNGGAGGASGSDGGGAGSTAGAGGTGGGAAGGGGTGGAGGAAGGAGATTDGGVPPVDPCPLGAAPNLPADSPRILVLGPSQPDATAIATHLAGLLAADPAFAAPEVVFQKIETTYGTSLMSYWYSPTGRDARIAVQDEPWTWVVLLDDASVALGYPELHFEGVRALACHARTNGARPILLSTWWNDSGEMPLRREIAYRVGNGTATPVVAAGTAWAAALSSAPALAWSSSMYVAAASLYSAITGKSTSTTTYQPAGIPAAQAPAVAAAVDTTLATELAASHYGGPYASVVQLRAAAPKELWFMDSGTSSEAIWEARMNEIVPALGMTPHATAVGACNTSKTFDATCLSNALPSFQSAQYQILLARDFAIDASTITSQGAQTDLQVQVWDRHADNVPADGAYEVDIMDLQTKPKRDQASQLGLAWIPYHVMFARLKTERPSIALTSDGTHATYPVGYGLATMSVVSRTGMHVPTTGLDADTAAAVRLGDETVRQLSSLSQWGAWIGDDPATRPKLP